ncbi:hypothetical protein I4641_06060 [Waterburya agarophytonicola K14]|uniref:Uncharacterized protein n=1 Tax=Waterburya agarophytonicola KI4 TaxID=2874699 RepID=A0A964BPQ8_9CYAN|nr:hypothetical protein [Waterburya agarophytonicola]MCC0176541.1 hypothetical protein [Waterburya agarophytonicola KI4]
MFSFFQDLDSKNDSIITLDTVNEKLHNKSKQSLILACFSILFLSNRDLIDTLINLLVHDATLGDQLGLGIYLALAMSALCFILGTVQKTSNLMSQRDEINNLLI